MIETEVFATAIEIRKVRHLENIKIEISETERKHLILTGKNGSGKTSVLEAMREFLELGFEKDQLSEIENYKKDYEYLIESVLKLKNRLRTVSEPEKLSIQSSINIEESNIKYYENLIQSLQNTKIEFSATSELLNYYHNNLFLLKVNGVQKIDFKKKYALKEKIGNLFVQHLVNLRSDKLEAKEVGEIETVNQIDHWFNNFEKALQKVLEEPNLKLDHKRQERTYEIKLGNGLTVDFNALSDGYSSIMIIVAELIMRMEAMNARNYDLQGIVLIDEIETHLHIDLQKKILPFLTTFFPKIQFIVTTHSPFVLNSIPNAVVFDLENRQRLENIEDISAGALVEYHFQVKEPYSEKLIEKMELFEKLAEKADLTDHEAELLVELEKELSDFSPLLSPEMYFRYHEAQQKLLS